MNTNGVSNVRVPGTLPIQGRYQKGNDGRVTQSEPTPSTAYPSNGYTIDTTINSPQALRVVLLPGQTADAVTITFTGVHKVDPKKPYDYSVQDDFGAFYQDHDVKREYDSANGTVSVSLPSLKGRKVEKNGDVIIRLELNVFENGKTAWSYGKHRYALNGLPYAGTIGVYTIAVGRKSSVIGPTQKPEPKK